MSNLPRDGGGTASGARMLVARVGGEYFGFPLADVREAVDAPVVTTVPLRPTGLLGQLPHRGDLLPVLDPGVLLGVPLQWPHHALVNTPVGTADNTADGTADDTPHGTALVMVHNDTPFALAVDDVTDMATVGADDRRALPEGADRTGMLAGWFAIDGLLVAAVDMMVFRATAATLLNTGTR